jgi:hypothetical protein
MDLKDIDPMSLLDVTDAEAAQIHDKSEKILNHKEKQYGLTCEWLPI